ncbi:MAG TPA: hypothetical protein VEJ63_22865 [Planctomycetota bacterium]|nr:hypothetical protein [Planctomycetota bacterium]
MKLFPFVIAVLCSNYIVAADPQIEKQEPKTEYYLDVGDRRLAVEVDKPFKVTPEMVGKELVLRRQHYRMLNLAGLDFAYPTDFNFKCKEEEGVTTWILSGVDCHVHLMQTDHVDAKDDTDAAAIAEGLSNTKLNPDAKVVDKSISLGKRVISGKRVAYTMVTIPMLHDIYVFNAGGKKYRLIITVTGSKEGNAAFERVSKLLTENSTAKDAK